MIGDLGRRIQADCIILVRIANYSAAPHPKGVLSAYLGIIKNAENEENLHLHQKVTKCACFENRIKEQTCIQRN